jgi:hypothetical protein
MKKLLAIGFTLAMVLGTVVGAMAFDSQRVAAPVDQMQQIEDQMGTLAPKDYCGIWCDQLGDYLWIWTASWLGPDCGFYKVVDPYVCDTSCLPPYFPFLIDYIRFGGHVYDWVGPDYFDLVCYFSVHEIPTIPRIPAASPSVLRHIVLPTLPTRCLRAGTVPWVIIQCPGSLCVGLSSSISTS